MNICVYGDFKKHDIRIKIFYDGLLSHYSFQNILRDAGYDAELFTVPDDYNNTDK